MIDNMKVVEIYNISALEIRSILLTTRTSPEAEFFYGVIEV